MSALAPRTPIHCFQQELVTVVIAIRDHQLDPRRNTFELITIVREYALPLGEASCLIGFAALAVAAGDHERASRHLASVRSQGAFPFRTPVEALVYRQAARAIRDSLDPDTAQRCRAEGAANPVGQALDAELARLEPSNPIGETAALLRWDRRPGIENADPRAEAAENAP